MTDQNRRRHWPGTSPELSASDLLRECGRKLTDRALWEKFQERFRKPIFTFLLRDIRQGGPASDAGDIVSDLAQDLYMRLVQNDGRVLRSFRGDTDFSALAFLASIAMSVVFEHHRRQAAGKRQSGQVISIEHARETDGLGSKSVELNVGSILSWIDMERLIASDSDQKHASRNIIILKLRYIDGLTNEEIAQFPGFGLNAAGVDTVLRRLKSRLQGGHE